MTGERPGNDSFIAPGGRLFRAAPELTIPGEWTTRAIGVNRGRLPGMRKVGTTWAI
jgi:hypothetical protein